MGKEYQNEFKAASKEVLRLANYKCQAHVSPRCENSNLHVHHRKLRSRGGDNSLSNLRAVCLNCHDIIHANPELATQTGWLVSSWDNPESIDTIPGLFKRKRSDNI